MADRRVPVAFITFNRPDTTKEVFAAIRAAAPERLYHISDAPREGNADDAVKVEECRSYVREHLDWDCELVCVYADKNMGCRERVSSGITEVLSKEERIIILEDDVVPSQAFFPYCEALLELYADDPKVMMISGTNLVREWESGQDYCFSCFPSVWGWATWARAWKDYDASVRDWPERKASGEFKGIYGKKRYLFLKRDIESVYSGKKDTWDIQWDYCRHSHRGLGIVPRGNMVRNIGFDREDATHTKSATKEDFSYTAMALPPYKKLPVIRDLAYDRAYLKKYFGLQKLLGFLKKKLEKIKK
ncbi:MAG: hypothetical protein IK115_02300 [Lachnospiraceae bacterium]|nr:hypothetical protein [Lachnospiraceae bacterium]